MPDVTVVFEVGSPTSVRIDRTLKLREYRAVPSIRRYVIVDTTGPDLTVYARPAGVTAWMADALTAGEMLDMTEIGIAIPVDEIFAGVAFDNPTASA